jgi:hypothetical protein
MATDLIERHWFDTNLIKTDALKKVVLHSLPAIEKQLRYHLKNLFLDTGSATIKMSTKNIKEEVFSKNGIDENYIDETLKRRWKMERDKQQRYTYPAWREISEGVAVPDSTEMIFVKTKKRVDIPTNERPFVFKMEDFVPAEERSLIEVRETQGGDLFAEVKKPVDPDEILNF